MTFNDAGLKLIREFEGCALTAYQDIGGVWTIGWGDTENVSPGRCVSQAEADERLDARIQNRADQVSKCLLVSLNDNQFSALVCFTYNEGCGHLKISTLLQKVNASDFAGAAEEFLRWDKVNGQTVEGLLRRRKAERELFLSA